MVRTIEELDDIFEEIHKKVFIANRNGELDDLLLKLGLSEFVEKSEQSYTRPKFGKIVVVGDSEIDKNTIISVFENSGINRERLEFCLDYNDVEKYDFEKLRSTISYSAILVGPMPHSVINKGTFSSIISKMENENGYPSIVRVCSGNQLKITKSGLKKAIQYMLNKQIICLSTN